MSQHSVKVPRLYKVAATVAKEAHEGLGSIKHLVYEKKKKHPNIKAVYALVATLFQRKAEVENLLKRSQFITNEPKSDPWLIKILIVELIWGKKRLPGQSKPENTVRAYEQIFKAHMSDSKTITIEEHDTKGNVKPRYVRVNTLSITLNEAVDGFRDEGWVLSKFFDKTNYQEFLEKITSLGEEEFLVDIHIPNLLIFPPRTQFYNHPAYKNGSIILQDKASCLPVHILAPPPGSTVLDMCAAPGMKTTHLAAALNDNGTVYAVERDPKRFETLNRIVDSSGAKCVKTLNKDVLTCNAKDFPGVEYILVDPSCSGSGMTDRLAAKEGENSRNFDKLTGFQILILRSALTRYPDVKKVVYSTCSVYSEENEDVVRQVLETNYNFKLVDAKKYVNNTWKNYGSSDFGDLGNNCLYAKPNEDFTNGFFVAVFERLAEGEENKFFNTKIFNYKKHINAKEKRNNERKRKFEGEAIKNRESSIKINNTANTITVQNQNTTETLEEEDGENYNTGETCSKDITSVVSKRKMHKHKTAKALVEKSCNKQKHSDIFNHQMEIVNTNFVVSDNMNADNVNKSHLTKKKKHKKDIREGGNQNDREDIEIPDCLKRSEMLESADNYPIEQGLVCEEFQKKEHKKKKRKKDVKEIDNEMNELPDSQNDYDNAKTSTSMKKLKRRSQEAANVALVYSEDIDSGAERSKKKKRSKNVSQETYTQLLEEPTELEDVFIKERSKNKSKKKKNDELQM